NADVVPIGNDQKQHLELARNIAVRFNGIFPDVFRVPEPYMPKQGARVMSLQDPAKKMSKSDPNPNSYVSMLDDRDTIVRKFKRAVTDSGAEVRRGEGKDGINNLIDIYCAACGKTPDEVEREFAGKGYGDFKLAVGEAVADVLAPIKAEFDRLMGDKAYLEKVCADGADAALGVSSRTLRKVYKKVGLLQIK
ncbi:MAG: tryptophan--tRNA ligase, partial [Clostridia bacterium]|nr:tryptophan--tRNA ligase [Clostridia bacterium]